MRITRVHSLPALANYDYLDSPVGVLTMVASPQGLHAVLWDNDDENLFKKFSATQMTKPSCKPKDSCKNILMAKEKVLICPL